MGMVKVTDEDMHDCALKHQKLFSVIRYENYMVLLDGYWRVVTHWHCQNYRHMHIPLNALHL